MLLAMALLFPVRAAAADADPNLLFLQSLDQRIADVSWRIGRANADLCQTRMSGIGIAVHDAAQYAPRYRETAVKTFGFRGGLPAVLAVAVGGPADLAGIQTGDTLTAIDGVPLPQAPPGPRGKEDYEPISEVMAHLEAMPTDRPITLNVLRDGGAHQIALRSVPICRSRVEVVPGNEINANSNGLVVQIYGKLALWTKSDDELAIVIAHEMAHNLLGHNQRIKNERIGSGFLASLGGDGRKMRDFEREADRYGLYLVARAGYDYSIADGFWRRLAMTSGLSAVWATTHPTAKGRASFNEGVIAEIRRAKAEGRAVLP